MRSEPPSYEELFEIVTEGMDELQEWCVKWSDMMGTSALICAWDHC